MFSLTKWLFCVVLISVWFTGWIVCCLVALMVICFSCGCGGLCCLCSGLRGFVVRDCGGCGYGVLLFIVAWLCYLLCLGQLVIDFV